jgi:DNA-binding NarL/FixJ family response regulator
MTEARRRLRVIVADDHPVVLAGIKALLQSAPEIDLVGEAMTGLVALDLIRSEHPDIAILDLTMPELSGLELAERVADEAPGVRVIALTVHEDRAYIQPMLQAGARGYLLKRSAAEDLVRAVRAVAAGGVYLDPTVADKAIAQASSPSAPEGETLSPRETDVMRFAAHGFSNKEIAGRLAVSVKTVETYKARACEKLGLRTRSQIVRFGASKGWLDDIAAPG